MLHGQTRTARVLAGVQRSSAFELCNLVVWREWVAIYELKERESGKVHIQNDRSVLLFPHLTRLCRGEEGLTAISATAWLSSHYTIELCQKPGCGGVLVS